MDKTTLEMMYELVEIDDVSEEGYHNCVDITVDSTTSTPPACQSKNSTVH